MLKQHKIKIFLSSLFTLIPSVFGLLSLTIFKDKINGYLQTEAWIDVAKLIFALPFFLVLLNLVCIFITFKFNGEQQNKKVLNLIFFIIPVLSFFSCGICTMLVFNVQISMSFFVSLLLGFTFIIIGNYLPKCTRNITIGIKIKWALQNEENWNATHRFSGKLWFFGGIAILFSAFLPESIFLIAILPIIFFIVFVSAFYSYFYYKKQVKNGTWKEDAKPIIYSKKATAFITAFVCIILVFCAVMLFTGDINITLNKEQIQIEASYWSDLHIQISEIESIEYRANIDGQRVSGVGTPRLLIGFFRNEEFGNYTRYTYAKIKPCLVLTINGNKTVINMKTEEDTKNLYEEIKALVSE